MAIDPRIEPLISPLVERVFPDVYREEGPLLVTFMRRYMEWAESADGPLYHSRRLMDYGDVDLTPDSLLQHLRAKYLPGVPQTPDTNTRTLVKHCLDLYRSRGTPRAVDLFYRLAYGVSAQVYYPSEDLFRASAGRYVKPLYIELILGSGAELSHFVGRQVEGRRSGAKAFVERAFRKLIKGKLVDSLAISAVQGTFIVGEPVDAPTAHGVITGSLSRLEVVDGVTGLSVGDRLDITGGSGAGAQLRITETSNVQGLANISLHDGGWGYTMNACTTVSARVLTLNGVTVDANSVPLDREYFTFTETLTQPRANLYVANVSLLSRGMVLTARDANSLAIANLVVLSTTTTNSTSGHFEVSITTGNTATTARVYAVANAFNINVSSVTDHTATGRVIAGPETVQIALTAVPAGVLAGDIAMQTFPVANGTVKAVDGDTLTLIDTVGRFISNGVINTTRGYGPFMVSAVGLDVAVDEVTGGFLVDSLAYTRCDGSNTRSAGVSTKSEGADAAFAVSAIADTETLSLLTDYVYASRNTALNANVYNLPANSIANSGTLLLAALTLANVTIGRISTIHQLSRGIGYTVAPRARAYEPITMAYDKKGWECDITNASSAYQLGELVTQASTGARGYIQAANTSHFRLRRASLLANFLPTTNSTSTLVGESSGAVSEITSVYADTGLRPEEPSALLTGIDSSFDVTTAVAPGVAAHVAVEVGGFGYQEGDVVSFTTAEGYRGLAIVHLGGTSLGAGYYATTGSQPSGVKRIHDGDYWQELSYEVLSGVSPQTSAPARELLHVAGTKGFHKLRRHSTASAPVTGSVSVTQS